MLGGLEKTLLAVLLIVLMAGMGATLTPESFREIARRPRGVLVGLASQFGWMPLIAFGLARGLELPAELAIGLVIVGATPGGTTSNLFTYYSRADLALSIGMTVVSTLVAVVAMPLLLMLYATPFTDESLTVPYGNIVTTLLLVLVPVAAGMLARRRSESLALRLERLGSVSGVVVLLVLVGASLARNADVLALVPSSGYLATVALGLLGMGLGYLAARLCGLPSASRRAVALETGIQNSPLAFAIIIASFPEALHAHLLWLPMLYALFVLFSATGVTLYFRRSPGERTPPTAAAQ